ncbi:MAG TPA: IS1380 family transposase [Gemmatimonas sp.]|nr:IS1380 family transposase [Gemmatimonas sp.]
MKTNKGPHAPTTARISPIEVQFQGRCAVLSADAAQSSSDGGVVLLRQLDERLGLTARMAALLGDPRKAERVWHSRLEQVRQRIYQICLGYEDCNDGDWLRHDPAFQFACDAEGHALSSQPTLSRFENAITGRELNRLCRDYEQGYVDGLTPTTELVVLDIDSTDDATHGAQQLSFFHGFYDQHMFHPLLVFDALSGHLITALLRPGRAHAAKGAITILTRLIRAIRQRCPQASILVRGDSAFAMPKLLDRLAHLDAELGDVDYVIGVAKNSRLLEFAKPLRAAVEEEFADGAPFVRRFTWLSYASKSWPAERHVICKVEHSSRGENPRFVVTTLHEFPPGLIYDVAYCARGQSENFIKDFKNALHADRLSCHRFVANAFRLLLHVIAYRLMHALRATIARVAPEAEYVSTDRVRLATAQMDTIRLRLLKVAVTVTSSVRRVLIRLPRAFPLAHIFLAVARHLGVT